MSLYFEDVITNFVLPGMVGGFIIKFNLKYVNKDMKNEKKINYYLVSCEYCFGVPV